MIPQDFLSPEKLRDLAVTANEARSTVIRTGRQNLENVINNLNTLAAIYETHLRSAREAQALKNAGITRAPPKSIVAEVADRVQMKKRKKKDENELPDADE